MRDFVTRWRRREKVFERRNESDRAQLAARRWGMMWDQIHDLLVGENDCKTDLPPLLEEALRKDGLI